MTVAGPKPYFERSEQAIASVQWALARYRVEESAKSSRVILRRSRLRSRARTSDVYTAARAEDALTRMMGIAEHYIGGMLIELTERALPASDLVAVLWQWYERRETDSWERQRDSWKALHTVSLSTFPSHAALLGFIEARNAVVHGLGSLTRKQLRNRSGVSQQLRDAGIRLSGDRVVLTTAHATGCAEVIRDLINWLDQEAVAVL